MKKISKVNQKHFINGVQHIIETYKATENTDNHYKWVLNTKAGKLYITIHDDNELVLGVFCKFDDVEKAKTILDPHSQTLLNPYSGKWNFLSSDVVELLYNFNSELELIVCD